MEMGDFQKFYDKYKDSDIVLLSINIGETKEAINQVTDVFELSFPVLMDDNYDVWKKYGPKAIPMTIVINEEGIIEKRHMGALKLDELEQMIK